MLSVRSFISRAPGWVWLLVMALFLAVLLYATGRRSGLTTAHRVALADSTHTARAKIEVLTTQVEHAVKRADKLRAVSDKGRGTVHAILADTSHHTDAATIAAVTEQLATDSTTIVEQSHTIVLLQERDTARVQLDTITQHQLVLNPPDDGGLSVTAIAEVLAVLAVIAVVVEAVRWLLNIVH